MNLPKTLIQMKKNPDSLILCFDDNEVVKFEAEIDSDPECDWPALRQIKPTMHEKLEIGAISQEDFDVWVAKGREELDRQASEDAKLKQQENLFAAWRSYHKYGEEGGFTKPSKYPKCVIDFIGQIDWSEVKDDHKNIMFKGLIFRIKRPTDEQ
jgi:hypothetical protein